MTEPPSADPALPALPADWARELSEALSSPSFATLRRSLEVERAHHTVYPPAGQVFAAFDATPFRAVKVVILGQDPYHRAGQAHGLSFSVPPGVPPPPSLRNIFKELEADLGVSRTDGDLTRWATQGVLLLNTVLTVREGAAASHAGLGWEAFTDAVITALNRRERPVVFVLWGNHAKKKRGLVDTSRHGIVEGAHPSPLSAAKWFGSRPFSAIDRELERLGSGAISW